MASRRRKHDDLEASDAGGLGEFEKEVRQIHKLLDRIPEPFKEEEFNPLIHVIDIMKADDTKERKKQLDSDCSAMEKAMETIVSAHYEGFNKAITNYTSILTGVTTSSGDVQGVHDNSDVCSTLFSSRSHSVNAMYIQSLEYHYMIEILDKVEFIKQVPDKYLAYLQDGNYLEASKLLVNANEMLGKEDLDCINALIDRKRDIRGLRENFHETIIDVLHEYIYLNFEVEPSEEELRRTGTLRRLERKTGQKDLGETLNKETMHRLVESLFVLDRVKEGTTALMERVRPEIRQIIQKTVYDLKLEEEAHENKPGTPTSAEKSPATNGGVGTDLAEGSPLFVNVLNLVFEKCKVIIGYHRSVSEKLAALQQEKLEAAGISVGHRPQVQGILDGGLKDYKIENVWEEFQKELLAMITFYIDASMDATNKKLASAALSSAPKLFSFAASSAFSTPDEGENEVEYEDLELGPVSPYNLPPLYPLIASFTEAITNRVLAGAVVVPSKDPSAANGAMVVVPVSQILKHWIDDYVNNTFLQNIKSDYKNKATAAADVGDMFKIKEIARATYSPADNKRPLLENVVTIHKCIKELYLDTIYMPQYSAEFAAIMEVIISTFFETCLRKYDEIVKDTEAAKMVKMDEVFKAATTDIHWKRLLAGLRNGNQPADATPPGTSNSQDLAINLADSFIEAVDDTDPREAKYDFEINLYRGLNIAGQPLTKKLLLADKFKIVLLSILNDNVTWFCERVESLEKGDLKKKQPTEKTAKRPGSTGLFTPRAGRHHKRTGSNAPELARLGPAPKVSAGVTELLKELRSLADRCLVTLRTELRLRCFTHLDALKRSSFVFDQESKEPDSCITELNADLMEAHEVMYSYLPHPKIRYVYGSLPKLASALLIGTLSRIESINKWGVTKMTRNVFSIQQNLTNIITFNQEPFDRVRRYYELLNLSADEVFQRISEHLADPAKLFTMQEYRMVLELLTPGKKLTDKLESDLREKFARVRAGTPAAAAAGLQTN